MYNQANYLIYPLIFQFCFSEEVWLDLNFLSGTIPTEIGTLTTLGGILLDSNSLQGTIPTEIGNLGQNLDYFIGEFNNFVGTVPSEIGRLFNTRTFHFDNTDLTGTIPTEVCILSLSGLNLELPCPVCNAPTPFPQGCCNNPTPDPCPP